MTDRATRRFGFHGRVMRLEWWLMSLGVTLGRFVATILGMTVAGHGLDHPSMVPFRVAVDLFFLWPSAAVVIKRGHDRDRSALYSGIVLALVYAPGMVFGFLMDGPPNALGRACVLMVLVGWIYMMVDYGLIDGTNGPNRYGPSPKGRQGVGVELAQTFD